MIEICYGNYVMENFIVFIAFNKRIRAYRGNRIDNNFDPSLTYSVRH